MTTGILKNGEQNKKKNKTALKTFLSCIIVFSKGVHKIIKIMMFHKIISLNKSFKLNMLIKFVIVDEL